jgi:hypothetical protein
MASMWTLIIKNNSAITPREIEDLGITIGISSQVTMSDQFEYQELASSDDLRDHVTNSNLVVNDGTSDLDAATGVLYLTLYNAKETEEDFYTRTKLGTSGQSSVHWDNITNTPAFGTTTWLDPVICRSLTMTATGPAASEGDFFIDTDDDHLYKYISSSWVDQGAPSTGDRTIVLDSTAEMIYEWGGSTWDVQDDNGDLDAVLLLDDGDSKQAQYVYEIGSLSWIKIADIDYGEPNTLDGAYDQGGAGAGRTIDADSGAVKLDVGVSTNAPIELTQKASLPTTSLAAGQLAVKDGILCVYDGTRSKWLSVQRVFLTFGRKGVTRNQYLSYAVGTLASAVSGYLMGRNATVVSITGQLGGSGTIDFRLRSNDSVSNVATLSLTATDGDYDNALNVDLTQGDYLQMFADNATTVGDPVVIVEIAFRP